MEDEVKWADQRKKSFPKQFVPTAGTSNADPLRFLLVTGDRWGLLFTASTMDIAGGHSPLYSGGLVGFGGRWCNLLTDAAESHTWFHYGYDGIHYVAISTMIDR
jgi:hypothetical protein